MNSHIMDCFLRLLRCFRHSLLVLPVPRKVHVFAILLVIVFTGCNRSEKPELSEKITIAYSTNSNVILMYTAIAKGFLTAEKLDVTPQPHAFGKIALNAVIEGKADLATVADTPIMFAIMGGKKIATLAVIQKSNINEGIVVRRESGIKTPADLKGKTIAVTRGTTSDFFAYSFLIAHGVDVKQVRIVDMTPEKMSAALGSGEVDAVSTWNPTLKHLQNKFGDRVRTFLGEDIFTETMCVATNQTYVTQHPETVKKVLRALLKAETFVRQHPEESRTIVADFVKTDKSVLDETWNGFTCRVTLDQALIVGLESQTRWAINNNLVLEKHAPNYLDFMYIDGLLSVKSDAVRLIK